MINKIAYTKPVDDRQVPLAIIPKTILSKKIECWQLLVENQIHCAKKKHLSFGITMKNDKNANFDETNAIHTSKALLESSHRYLDWINQISKGEVFPHADKAATLLVSDCKKVLNGQIFTQNREAFVSDLLSVYQKQGAWNVNPVDIIVATSSNTVVLRLMIEMENDGTYTAIVILRYNSDLLITEINEVLSKV